MRDDLLSFVVIGRNEGQRLARCLQSIAEARQAAKSVEIIYVDSNSTDNSVDLARSYGATVIELRSDRPTAALGRNAGWRAAQGANVLFLDGDTVLHPDFPTRALAALDEDKATAAVWGHRREIHPERSIYNRLLDLDWVYQPGWSEFCGGDVLMRRQALEEAGGYDAALIAGEEPDLCRRLRARGYRILHIDAPMTGHDLAMTRISQYWRRAVRAGHAFAEVSRRFRASNDPFWSAESKGNLRRGSFWIISLLVVVLAVWKTVIPLLVWCVLALLLVLRSAWRSRWKAPGRPLLLLAYGVHSHFQQIPILFGQLSYFRDVRLGRRRALIEYKESNP
jgi:glycosyltransferase involved in cell wall biosynthesis